MKHFIVLALTMSISSGQFYPECSEATKANKDTIERYELDEDLNFEDTLLNEYIYCTFQIKGWITHDNKFDQKSIVSNYEPFDQFKVIHSIKHCNGFEDIANPKTAFILTKCVIDATLREEDKISQICIEETSADRKLIRQIKDGNMLIDDKKVKKYVMCFMKKMKFVSIDNTLNKKAIMKKASKTNRIAYKFVIDKCADNLIKQFDDQSIWDFTKCFIKNATKYELI